MNSGFRNHFWRLVCSLALVCLLGCENNTTQTTRTTSHEDIVSFLEENPEFADPKEASSDTSELGLER